jgi:hypothetical protein
LTCVLCTSILCIGMHHWALCVAFVLSFEQMPRDRRHFLSHFHKSIESLTTHSSPYITTLPSYNLASSQPAPFPPTPSNDNMTNNVISTGSTTGLPSCYGMRRENPDYNYEELLRQMAEKEGVEVTLCSDFTGGATMHRIPGCLARGCCFSCV